jgi:hypothetical protein
MAYCLISQAQEQLYIEGPVLKANAVKAVKEKEFSVAIYAPIYMVQILSAVGHSRMWLG